MSKSTMLDNYKIFDPTTLNTIHDTYFFQLQKNDKKYKQIIYIYIYKIKDEGKNLIYVLWLKVV